MGVFLLGLVLPLGAQRPPAPATPKPFGEAYLGALQSHLEKERDQARSAQRESQATLDASRRLLDRAQGSSNPAAVGAAQQAVATAEKALAKNRLREERATKALAWVERLRSQKISARSLAGFMPRVEGTVEVVPAAGGPARRISGDQAPVAGPGDTVRTGKDGRADLLLPEGDLLSLDAGAAVTLSDEGLEVLAGVVKARIAKRFAAKFQVRTPSAVTSVRGTDFLVRELPGKPSSVVVFEGTVAFGDRAGRKTVLVEAGQQSYLLPDGTPAEPSKANLSEMRRWWDE